MVPTGVIFLAVLVILGIAALFLAIVFITVWVACLVVRYKMADMREAWDVELTT